MTSLLRDLMDIHVTQKIKATPEQLLCVLLDHEQLNRFFNAAFVVTRVSNEGEPAGGRGCLRQVTTRGNTFIEEIIAADLSGIQYRIVGDKPLKNHKGHIQLITANDETEIRYHIYAERSGWIPNFIIQKVLQDDISRAMKSLAAFFHTKG